MVTRRCEQQNECVKMKKLSKAVTSEQSVTESVTREAVSSGKSSLQFDLYVVQVFEFIV